MPMASRPAPSNGAPAPQDRVSLGAQLEEAGYSFGQCGPWYGSGQTRPVAGAEAEELLRSKKSVEVKTPQGYETLFDFAHLEAMHALASGNTELAKTMAAMPGVKFGQAHESRTSFYARISQGKSSLVRMGDKTFPVRNLDELKFFSYLKGFGAQAGELEHPERAASLKALEQVGMFAGGNHDRMLLYRHPPDSLGLGRMSFTKAELEDSALVKARLAPLQRLLVSLKDPKRAHEAEQMIRIAESDRPLEEKLERAEFAFGWGTSGHHDLYRELLHHDSLEQAEKVKQLTGEPYECRDALIYLRELPGQEQEFLRLLELSDSPRWSSRTLKKLGPKPTEEQLENAAWARLKWAHPTMLLTVRKPFSDETPRQRELALTRVFASCAADADATRLVWGELHQASSLDEAMQAHQMLNRAMRQIKARGPGWWEAECLTSLRQERRKGGALEGLSLLQGVERLLPFLRRGAEGILLQDHSAKEVVEGALRRLKSGESVRTGVEERDGGIIVGGVRVPTRQ